MIVLTRRQDWVQRLVLTVHLFWKVPFDAKKFNCAIWAAECIDAVCGSSITQEIKDMLATYGMETLMKDPGIRELVKGYLGEPVTRALARRGDLMLFNSPNGEMLGVCTGSEGIVTGPQGLQKLPASEALCAWRVG